MILKFWNLIKVKVLRLLLVVEYHQFPCTIIQGKFQWCFKNTSFDNLSFNYLFYFHSCNSDEGVGDNIEIKIIKKTKLKASEKILKQSNIGNCTDIDISFLCNSAKSQKKVDSYWNWNIIDGVLTTFKWAIILPRIVL